MRRLPCRAPGRSAFQNLCGSWIRPDRLAALKRLPKDERGEKKHHQTQETQTEWRISKRSAT